MESIHNPCNWEGKSEKREAASLQLSGIGLKIGWAILIFLELPRRSRRVLCSLRAQPSKPAAKNDTPKEMLTLLQSAWSFQTSNPRRSAGTEGSVPADHRVGSFLFRIREFLTQHFRGFLKDRTQNVIHVVISSFGEIRELHRFERHTGPF